MSTRSEPSAEFLKMVLLGSDTPETDAAVSFVRCCYIESKYPNDIPVVSKGFAQALERRRAAEHAKNAKIIALAEGFMSESNYALFVQAVRK